MAFGTGKVAVCSTSLPLLNLLVVEKLPHRFSFPGVGSSNISDHVFAV